MNWLMWALAGWCGTPWPWWRHWPPTPPGPDPDPWWVKGLGVLGGLGGGWLFHTALNADPLLGIVGGFIGGRVLSDLGSTILSRGRG